MYLFMAVCLMQICKKKKIYDNWMNNPLIKDFLTKEFVDTVSNLIHFILYFKKQNDKLLQLAK